MVEEGTDCIYISFDHIWYFCASSRISLPIRNLTYRYANELYHAIFKRTYLCPSFSKQSNFGIHVKFRWCGYAVEHLFLEEYLFSILSILFYQSLHPSKDFTKVQLRAPMGLIPIDQDKCQAKLRVMHRFD